MESKKVDEARLEELLAIEATVKAQKEKAKEQGRREWAKMKVILRKAKEAGITASEEEVQVEVKKMEKKKKK
jgi:hypothetical protein